MESNYRITGYKIIREYSLSEFTKRVQEAINAGHAAAKIYKYSKNRKFRTYLGHFRQISDE